MENISIYGYVPDDIFHIYYIILYYFSVGREDGLVSIEARLRTGGFGV
jgi:hypothetical protein